MVAKTFSNCARAFALATGAAAFLFVDAAFAQVAPRPAPGAARAAGSPKATLRIKDISKPGKQSLVASPDIGDNKVKSPGHLSRGQNWKWAMLEVKYETSPEWIDEVTFTFYVLCKSKDAKTGAEQYHLFQTAVSYLDIEKGDHHAAVLLPPNAVKRYGEPMAYGVDIAIAGESVDTLSSGFGKDKEAWWNSTGFNKLGDRLVRHSGYLKDRSQTPFGVTHVDEYEAVR